MTMTARQFQRQRGFSLVEMLAAATVFTIISLMVVSMTDGITSAVTSSNQNLDLDSEARLIFGLLERDLDQVVSNGAADLQMIEDDNGTLNDALYFFTESPAFSDFDTVDTGRYSLVGYRTATKKNDALALQFERLGVGLAWDTNTSGSPAQSDAAIDQMVFVSYDTLNGAVRSQGQIDNRWSTLINTSTVAEDSPFYSVVGPQIIRFEHCFLLKDGTYSNYPVIPDTLTPSTTAPGQQSGQVGDRWFNETTGRAFICQAISPPNDPNGNRVWLTHGLEDVAAVVFTVVLLDERSRLIAGDTNNLIAL
ncbi:MAG: prepilin-type N-terminal cleavage/methylation domain-containing protein, partial [Verrucomicrobiota bacterium]